MISYQIHTTTPTFPQNSDRWCAQRNFSVTAICTLQKAHFRDQKTTATGHPGGTHVHSFCRQSVKFHRAEKGFPRSITEILGAFQTQCHRTYMEAHLGPSELPHASQSLTSQQWPKMDDSKTIILGGNNNKRKSTATPLVTAGLNVCSLFPRMHVALSTNSWMDKM